MTQLQASVTDVTADGRRVITYPLTPTGEQLERLEAVRAAHARAYNLLAREFIAHRRTGTLTAKRKMQQVLVQLQNQFPALAGLSRAGLDETLSRVLNQAAQLVKRFPDQARADDHLFVAEDRYPGWAYPAKSSDWRLHVEDGVVTAIWLADVGFIATMPGPVVSESPRQVRITRRTLGWSLTYEVPYSPNKQLKQDRAGARKLMVAAAEAPSIKVRRRKFS